MAYTPKHPNESIVICRRDTGEAVCEVRGSPGRFEKLKAALKESYFALYVGDYLARINTKTKEHHELHNDISNGTQRYR